MLSGVWFALAIADLLLSMDWVRESQEPLGS